LIVKLIVQPDDGIAPLVAAVKSAKKTIDILIFRFDRKEIEVALKAAVERGVAVRALVAHTNRGGERNLRNLEGRLLEMGITVTRTTDDLSRYHGKMMIIDSRMAYVLSFNFAHMDIDHSRGFGIVTHNAEFIQEGKKLFEADAARQPYAPGLNTFLVSPLNARKELSAFIKKARKQLLIYDPRIADPQMMRLLQDRLKAGVEIRIIGRVAKRKGNLKAAALTTMHLHTRTIICDRRQAFVGSQSLRQPELDSRREIGLIVRHPKVVNSLVAIFEKDWASTDFAREQAAAKTVGDLPSPQQANDEAARILAQELPPLATTVRSAVKKAVAKAGDGVLADENVKATVKKAVKKAVKEAIKEVVQERGESN
jgi:phosphatidylserine/phosphatidylglycerophosphate/cardiolipin synthase-like enzyme